VPGTPIAANKPCNTWKWQLPNWLD
jgi:hypothetical protein